VMASFTVSRAGPMYEGTGRASLPAEDRRKEQV
jgi:hypothetical protein